MPEPTNPTCPRCQGLLEWLGSHTQRVAGGPAVKIVHWVCTACGTRWVEHSERGWRSTNVDLTAD